MCIVYVCVSMCMCVYGYVCVRGFVCVCVYICVLVNVCVCVASVCVDVFMALWMRDLILPGA